MKKLLPILLISIIYFSACGTPSSLEIPEIYEIDSPNNGSINLEGICYPKASVQIYINDIFTDSVECDSSGEFSSTVSTDKEGNNHIKIKQRYTEVTSELSKEHSFEADLTAPEGEVTIDTIIPEYTNQSSLRLSGTASDGDNIVINTKTAIIDENQTFDLTINLAEGKNAVDVHLADNVGNMTDAPFDSPAIVIKDSQKPSFQTGLFACKNPNPYKSTQETVCLNVGEFTGPLWGTAYAPFMGTVIGDIYTIKVDNTYVKWSEDGIINQRVPLYVQEGQNNYDVEIIDMAGNKTTDLYTISWGDKYQESQDNLYDQINDLESRLEELE